MNKHVVVMALAIVANSLPFANALAESHALKINPADGAVERRRLPVVLTWNDREMKHLLIAPL